MDKYEHDITIVAVALIVFMIAAAAGLIVFACTKSKRDYKRIKNMAEAEGRIIDIKYIRSPHADGYDYYVISYSFTDCDGKTHNKSFQRQRKENLEKGDKLTVYYDMECPDKCVTEYKITKEKNMWWQGLIIFAILIIIPFIVVKLTMS